MITPRLNSSPAPVLARHHLPTKGRDVIVHNRLKRRPVSIFNQSARPIPCLWLWCVILMVLFAPSICAQQVIVHGPLSDWEDGSSPQDGDGAKNGVVVWRGGAVHVVRGSYTVNAAYGQATGTLSIEPGAIVKVAGEFNVDDHGNLISWTPTFAGSGHIDCGLGGNIRIEGATITDIRDDTEGGDINQDGSATAPDRWGLIALSGTDKDVIRNSTIKYLVKMGHLGNLEIAENRFLFLSIGLESSSSFPGHSGDVVLNAAPIIAKNLFEFDATAGRLGRLDLRGMSPLVEGNTIRNAGTAIEVGPRFQHGSYPDQEPAGPITGTTVITDNTIEDCANGVLVASHYPYFPQELIQKTPPFRAEVTNNRLRGIAQGVGISVGFSALANISGNEVTKYGLPFNVYHDTRYDRLDPGSGNGLQIHDNRFSTEGAYSGPDSTSYRYWGNGVYVNAEHNYWGDPTGPRDNSDKDGLYNPHGHGIGIGNGIDYKPFIGGSAPPVLDAVRINASCSTPSPLAPKSSVTFTVSVEYYELRSASSGQIIALVRDQDGTILNGTGTMVTVNSQNHSTNCPAIPIMIPEFAGHLRVEAVLAPDGGSENVHSNSAIFMVNRPPSAFSVKSVVDGGTGQFPQLSSGSNYQIRFTMAYTLASTGNGQFEFDLKERTAGTGAVLRDLPLTTLGIVPGSSQEAQKEVLVDLPVRDAEVSPASELYYQVTMKDDAGAVVGRQSGVLPVTFNRVAISVVAPAMVAGDRPWSAGRVHFLVGEMPFLLIGYEYCITSPNVTNWQVLFGPLEALDSKGAILHSYQSTQAHVQNLGTGCQGGPIAVVFLRDMSGQPIPLGARNLRLRVRMVDPSSGTTMAVGRPYVVEVREASQTVQVDIPAGASQVAFSPIPVRLNFANNQSAGTATAEEFQGRFGGTPPEGMLAKTADFYWDLVPINRYWSVYDTLKRGTFTATVRFTYDPAADFPAVPGFTEDSLVVAGLNPMSGELEPLASTLDKVSHTLTADYAKFFDTYVLASRTRLATAVHPPHAGTALPDDYRLEQNYPNPLNPTTTIQYALPQRSHVTLTVYNMLGQQVATLVNGDIGAGYHSVQFDGSNLASGVYFYRLQAENCIEARKLVLMK